jgi:Bifunctional DNA primase/polymerase, N-terminal
MDDHVASSSDGHDGSRPTVGDCTAADLLAIRALRARLWNDGKGYRSVAVASFDVPAPGHHSAGKRPLRARWQDEARHDPPRAATVCPTLKERNTGLLCDGLQFVDIDRDDPDEARLVVALAKGMLGEAPMRYRAGSSRVGLLYRAASGEPGKQQVKSLDGQQGVEVLGRGQQFVAFGTHKTGARLEWTQSPLERMPETLTAVTEGQIEAFLDAVSDHLGWPRQRRAGARPGAASQDAKGDVAAPAGGEDIDWSSHPPAAADIPPERPRSAEEMREFVSYMLRRLLEAPGDWHNLLFAAAVAYGGCRLALGISAETALGDLTRAAARYAQALGAGGEREVLRVARDGLRYGEQSPFPLFEVRPPEGAGAVVSTASTVSPEASGPATGRRG